MAYAVKSLYNEILIRKFAAEIYLSAKTYLFLNNRKHRHFRMFAGLTFIGLITCFILYAIAEKYQETGNFFYSQVKFSFVDWGYPETAGYALELVTAVLLFSSAVLHKQKAWFTWSAIFTIVLLDDSLRIHENLGILVGQHFGYAAPVCEALGFAMLGVVLMALWAYRLFTMNGTLREFATFFLFSAYLGILIGFGVGVDAVHGLVNRHFHIPDTLMTLAEDGMELFMITVCAVTALGLRLSMTESFADKAVLPR